MKNILLDNSFIAKYSKRMEDNTLNDIVDAIVSWSTQILDAESKLKHSQDLRQDIVDSVQRQLLDGLISEQDSKELVYVADLWANLYKAFLCKDIGADFADRDVLTFLLELFKLRQIKEHFFIQIALQLCRTDTNGNA